MKVASKLVRGAAAGALATVVMSGFMLAAKAVGLLGEPPPRKITRALLRSLSKGPRRETTDALTVVNHVAYGSGAGALHSILPALWPSGPRALRGAAYGVLVWTVSYAGWIPAVGIMRYPTRDRRGRPAAMILAHTLYGAATALLEDALGGPDERRRRRIAAGVDYSRAP